MNINSFLNIKITQVRSISGRSFSEIKTLQGLGLRNIGDNKIVLNTDCVMGMINKVQHLIKIENIL